MSTDEGFDFRRHHGFRNPPVLPPLPFPGALESTWQAQRFRHQDPRDRITFRRAIGPWKSSAASVLPQDSRTPVPPRHGEQHGRYWDGYCETLSYGQQPFPPPPHFRPAKAYDYGSTDHNGTSRASGDGVESEQQQRQHQQQPHETLGTTRSTGATKEHHHGVAPQASSSEVGDRNILDAFNSDSGGGGEGGGGVNLAGGDIRLEESETTSPISESIVLRPSGSEEGFVEGQEGAVEEECMEEMGLIMSPEWTEHFRNSEALQRYLRRAQNNSGGRAMGGRGSSRRGRGRGKGRGTSKSNSACGKGAGAASEKKQAASRKGKNSDVADVEESEKTKAANKALELQLAKMKAQALLYAQGRHQPLEGIAEEC